MSPTRLWLQGPGFAFLPTPGAAGVHLCWPHSTVWCMRGSRGLKDRFPRWEQAVRKSIVDSEPAAAPSASDTLTKQNKQLFNQSLVNSQCCVFEDANQIFHFSSAYNNAFNVYVVSLLSRIPPVEISRTVACQPPSIKFSWQENLPDPGIEAMAV